MLIVILCQSKIQNYLGVPIDMLDLSTITLSKDYYNFTNDEENFYVEVAKTIDTKNPTIIFDSTNIVSDSEIQVTLGVVENGKTCESGDRECYSKTKTLTLRKADSGFTILGVKENSSDDNKTENE